jgi:hypothetical protein
MKLSDEEKARLREAELDKLKQSLFESNKSTDPRLVVAAVQPSVSLMAPIPPQVEGPEVSEGGERYPAQLLSRLSRCRSKQESSCPFSRLRLRWLKLFEIVHGCWRPVDVIKELTQCLAGRRPSTIRPYVAGAKAAIKIKAASVNVSESGSHAQLRWTGAAIKSPSAAKKRPPSHCERSVPVGPQNRGTGFCSLIAIPGRLVREALPARLSPPPPLRPKSGPIKTLFSRTVADPWGGQPRTMRLRGSSAGQGRGRPALTPQDQGRFPLGKRDQCRS